MYYSERKTFRFGFNDLNVTVPLIESTIGFNEGDDRSFVIELITDVLKEAQEVCDIKAQYTIFPDISFDTETRSVNISKVNFNIKKIVFGQLKKSEALAIFLCTAGAEIGIRSRTAMHDRDLLRGYIFDVIGSELVEAAADLMQAELENQMISSGLKITNRYSPGYCGWDVAEQHKVFQLNPDNYCGIKLTPSALMDPEKSVSGFIGIGANVKHNPYTCKICDMKDCIYRKTREKTIG